MSPLKYRPWGLLPWVLDRYSRGEWLLVGAISTEQRCLMAWEFLRQSGRVRQTYMARVEDPPSRYSAQIDAGLRDMEQLYIATGGDRESIHAHHLMAPANSFIETVRQFVASGGTRVVLDISTLPKRFFFPLVRLLYIGMHDAVTDLVVAYSVPRRYEPGDLAEEPEGWQRLPTFSGDSLDDQLDLLIASIGYMAMGLPDVVEKLGDAVGIKLLFPFPPGPPSFARNWEFVRQIEKNIGSAHIEQKCVDAHDVSDAFDFLCSMTNNGVRRALLAPFGPKPTSLAMCVFACLTGDPAFYTQPTVYHPAYSVGESVVGGVKETYAYCLRAGGQDLYTLT